VIQLEIKEQKTAPKEIPKAVQLTLKRLSQEKGKKSKSKCGCSAGFLFKN
jgi:hypothetical protein